MSYTELFFLAASSSIGYYDEIEDNVWHTKRTYYGSSSAIFSYSKEFYNDVIS